MVTHMDLELSYYGMPVNAEIIDNKLCYDCPFCKNGVVLNQESFRVTDEHQNVRTVERITCPWDNCLLTFEIDNNIFLMREDECDMREGNRRFDLLCKLWKTYNDRA